MVASGWEAARILSDDKFLFLSFFEFLKELFGTFLVYDDAVWCCNTFRASGHEDLEN